MHAWLEVDLDAVASNCATVQKHLGHTQIIAVVKADAYGHGIEAIARTLDRCGVYGFAVISLEEAHRVRSVSDRDVLIMGFLSEPDLIEAIRTGFVLSCYDLELAQSINDLALQLGMKARIQVKAESGLNRLGMPVTDAISLLQHRAAYKGLNIESVFTHLAQSSNREMNLWQLENVRPLFEYAEANDIPVGKHMMNSHALADFPEGHFDFVRVGLALYGVEPVLPNLFPSLQAKTVVMQVKPLPKGAGVSYNHLFKAESDMKIAVIAMGYAEGLSQALTHKATALIRGQERRILGQICMNLSVIDVTNLDVKRGDEVVLVGRQANNEIRVADLAKAAGIRHHEIVVRLGKSLPKIYVESRAIAQAPEI